MSIFETYGFVAVPDVPFLFFTVLFFLFYKRYLERDDWKNSLLLGVCISLLLYSKYHGLLILFFTILSNLKLLTRKSFYLVVMSSIILYIPHILWQVVHDYPSYQYHLLNKSQTPYDPVDSINFILGQLLVAGPFIGFFLFYAFFKHKATNALERSLKFTFIGFILFFLSTTLNTRVEPNWTLSAMVPLLAMVTIPITLINTYPGKVRFGLNTNYPGKLVYSIFKEETFDRTTDIAELGNLTLNSTYSTQFVLQVPEKAGVYYLRVCIQSGWMPPLINSHLMRMVVD